MDSGRINQTVLAWCIVCGFFSITLYLIYLSSDGTSIADTTGSVFMLIGAVATAFGSVINYFFGSTRSSSSKNEKLVEMAKAGDFSKVPCAPEVKDDKMAPETK